MIGELVQILGAIGGLAGLGGVVGIVLQRRKINAEARLTGARADSVITDSAIDLIEQFRAELKRTEAKLDQALEEISTLREHIVSLEDLLRQHNIRPPALQWRPNSQH